MTTAHLVDHHEGPIVEIHEDGRYLYAVHACRVGDLANEEHRRVALAALETPAR